MLLFFFGCIHSPRSHYPVLFFFFFFSLFQHLPRSLVLTTLLNSYHSLILDLSSFSSLFLAFKASLVTRHLFPLNCSVLNTSLVLNRRYIFRLTHTRLLGLQRQRHLPKKIKLIKTYSQSYAFQVTDLTASPSAYSSYENRIIQVRIF
jgi:hypothetical protein